MNILRALDDPNVFGSHFRGLSLKDRQSGIHFIEALLGPVEIKMHATLYGHHRLQRYD